ncbi:MAG: hypothetical protein JWP97_4725 [Labilithrix sp.]|nr:hypothetical protein [Labilithrix sp.]
MVACVGLSLVAAKDAGAQEPAAAPSVTPPPGAEQDRAPDSVYTRDGLLGPVRVGPTVGIGAPDGMRFGLFTTWRGLLGVGGALSVVPTTAIPGAAPAKVGRFSGEGFVRVHPFRGAFFLGVAGGVARTEGTTSGLAVASQPSSRVDVRASTNVMYVSPHLGFRWMLPFGMTAGIDAGVEIPVVPGASDVEASHDGQALTNVAGKPSVDKALRIASHSAIPVIHLLELGYSF